MHTILTRALMLAVAAATTAGAQGGRGGPPIDPYPQPLAQTEGVIRVNLVEFASVPQNAGMPARMMLLSNEPGTRRMFVNDMRGPLFSVSYDGKTVTPYLDINAEPWGVSVQSQGNERGFQSFAFHPQFNQTGSRGFGKFYTYTDTTIMTPTPDFLPSGTTATHDTVLLEWTARTPGATTYDGGAPREIIRLRQPYANHNAGLIAFNPLATPASADYGLLYMSVADGGSGGDPLKHAQNLGSAFGKIFRIDPLGTNSKNGKYGAPASNPFATNPAALHEIYALGVRNPQRFGWDSRNGNLFVAEIGQNLVEEISLVTAGANLGWNEWEASFKFGPGNSIDLNVRRGDPKMTYPIVEYDHSDPILLGRAAITGVVVYRGTAIPQLANTVIFGDNPSGQVFYFSADRLPTGGPDAIRRVMFGTADPPGTLLDLIKQKNPTAMRADLRFGTGPDNRIFLLNKQDGTIREMVR